MNKVLILIIFSSVCIISNAAAQNNKIQDHCKQFPMLDGDITYLADTSKVQPSTSFKVSSVKDDVYSLTQGKVAVVVSFPGKDYKAVGINYAVDTVIEYMMLMDVSLQVGDEVNKGDIIGKGTPNPKTGKNEAAIEIKILPKLNKLHDKDVMSFIKRADN